MITAIACCGASALRRLPPIADAIALRSRNVVSRPLRQPRISPGTVATQRLRDGTLHSGDPITASACTANHRITIAL